MCLHWSENVAGSSLVHPPNTSFFLIHRYDDQGTDRLVTNILLQEVLKLVFEWRSLVWVPAYYPLAVTDLGPTSGQSCPEVSLSLWNNVSLAVAGPAIPGCTSRVHLMDCLQADTQARGQDASWPRLRHRLRNDLRSGDGPSTTWAAHLLSRAHTAGCRALGMSLGNSGFRSFTLLLRWRGNPSASWPQCPSTCTHLEFESDWKCPLDQCFSFSFFLFFWNQ